MEPYRVRGYDNENHQVVWLELGWTKDGGYFFAVDDQAGIEIVPFKTSVIDISEVIADTRAYITWDLRLTLAAVRLPVDRHLHDNPASEPVSLILAPVSSAGVRR